MSSCCQESCPLEITPVPEQQEEQVQQEEQEEQWEDEDQDEYEEEEEEEDDDEDEDEPRYTEQELTTTLEYGIEAGFKLGSLVATVDTVFKLSAIGLLASSLAQVVIYKSLEIFA